MGTHYYIYAEVWVKDKWYNLNPMMKKHDGSFILRPICDSGSEFFDICNDLEEQRIDVGIPDDMSEELRAIYHKDLDEECKSWMQGTTWRQVYDHLIFCVRYSDTIEPRILKDRPHKYEGYVNKRVIADFETNEIHEIHSWLTSEEYAALPEKDKTKYSFYQWDEEFDEYQTYRTIYERLCALLYWFDFADAFPDKQELWQYPPDLNDVRLFIERT